MSQEKPQSWLFIRRTPTQMFSCCPYLWFLFLFLQVVVCITCVILQAKSEENAEAIESDMDFEGVFNHDNYKRSFIAEIYVIDHLLWPPHTSPKTTSS